MTLSAVVLAALTAGASSALPSAQPESDALLLGLVRAALGGVGANCVLLWHGQVLSRAAAVAMVYMHEGKRILSDRQTRLADLSVRAEQGVPAVRILHFDTGEGTPFEISAEASDLPRIAAVFAGQKGVAEPANRSRNWHDPVLARRYPHFECVVRLISADKTTFVFVTNHGHHMFRFHEELLPDLAGLLTRSADWAKSS